MPSFSLNNYVSAVAVISMDAQRQKKIQHVFAGINTEYKVFPGIRATPRDVKYRGHCRFICPPAAAIGCLLAHRSVWVYAIKNQLSSVAIFEDDVRFTDQFANVLPRAWQQLPDAWDILFLGCINCSQMTLVEKLTAHALFGSRTAAVPLSSHLTLVPHQINGLEGYIVSATGMHKLLTMVDLLYPNQHLD